MTQLYQGSSQAQQGATNQAFNLQASVVPGTYGATQPTNFQTSLISGPYESSSSHRQSPTQQESEVGEISLVPNGHESKHGTDHTAMHAQDLVSHGFPVRGPPMMFGSNPSPVQSLPASQPLPLGSCCSSLLLEERRLSARSIYPAVSPPNPLSHHTNFHYQNSAPMEGMHTGDFGDPTKDGLCKKENYSYQSPHGSLFNGPQTTLFSIPSFLATSDNPITPQQQSHLDQNHSYYTQDVPMHSQSGVMGLAAPSADSEGMHTHTNHACNCGPGCSCLYCPVHPFNEETKRHTQEIADLIPFADSGLSSPPQSGYDSSFASSEFIPNETNGNNNHHSGFVPPMPQLYPGQLPTPQSTLSPSLPEKGNFQSMVPIATNVHIDEGPSYPRRDSEYYHYTYAVGPAKLDCTAIPGTCACGDDCSCLGCLTHTGHTGEQ